MDLRDQRKECLLRGILRRFTIGQHSQTKCIDRKFVSGVQDRTGIQLSVLQLLNKFDIGKL
jgi:hypothetical protein